MNGSADEAKKGETMRASQAGELLQQRHWHSRSCYPLSSSPSHPAGGRDWLLDCPEP